METYIALLRGVNVGGKNKVKMSELKASLETQGLLSVSTYIQSGNVLFKSNQSPADVKALIEQTLSDEFQVTSAAIIRTAQELENLIAGCPFSSETIEAAEAGSDTEHLYAALLDSPFSEAEMARLGKYQNEDQIVLMGKDLYLLFFGSVRDSKLAVQIGKKEGPATVRNWNTLSKLNELAQTLKKIK